jgi:hypothetical protein
MVLAWDSSQSSQLFNEPVAEESIISEIQLRFSPVDAEFEILSTSLPYTASDLMKMVTPISTGVAFKNFKLPKITNTTKFNLVCRISKDGQFADKYFTLDVYNLNTTWKTVQNEYDLVPLSMVNIQLELENPDGTEVFKKISGKFPTNINLDETGRIYGTVSEIDSNTSFVFGVGVFRDGKLINNEYLQPKDFQFNVQSATEKVAPYWITEEGFIGSIEYGYDSEFRLVAYSPSGNTLEYRIISTQTGTNDYIAPGLSLSRHGYITGVLETQRFATWEFTVEAEDEITHLKTRRTFNIITNAVENQNKIYWYNNGVKVVKDEIINLGSYKIGEYISGIVEARCESGLPITYEISFGDVPQGFILYPSGNYGGNFGGEINYQESKEFIFTIKASNGFDLVEQKFKIVIESYLGYNAVNAYLRLNLDNMSGYNELKSQLKSDTAYKTFNPKFRANTFPKIDICKMKCFDKILLESMLSSYGNPEQIMFRETKQRSVLNGVDTYDVFYKTLDEETLQWTDTPYGTFDYNAELDELKDDNTSYRNAELEWNIPKDYYSTLEPLEEDIFDSYAGVEYYINDYSMKTLNIIPTPIESKVVVECNGYEATDLYDANGVYIGKTITVPEGLVVKYTISCEKYDTKTSTVKVDMNMTKYVLLLREKSNSLTVVCTQPENNYYVSFDTSLYKDENGEDIMPYEVVPSDETYVGGTRTIYVPDIFNGDYVLAKYSVESVGYVSINAKEVLVSSQEQTDYVMLQKKEYTFSIETFDKVSGREITNECDIELAGDGRVIKVPDPTGQITNPYIIVPYETMVHCKVDHTDYVSTENNYLVVDSLSSHYASILLTPLVDINITPSPSTALVTIYVDGEMTVSSTGNQFIRVPYGSNVRYVVEAEHYYTKQAEINNVERRMDISVPLEKTRHLVTIKSIPTEANIELSEVGGVGSIQGVGTATIEVPYGSYVNYVITCDHYVKIDERLECTTSIEKTIQLELEKHTLLINPTPRDAKVVMTSGDYKQSGNSITVPYGSLVVYELTYPHKEPIRNMYYVNYNAPSKTIDVTMEPAKIRATFVAVHKDHIGSASQSMIDIYDEALGREAFGGGEATIETLWGNSLKYTCRNMMCKSVDEVVVIEPTNDEDVTVYIPVYAKQYEFTIIPTPSDATVILSARGATQNGNTIKVPIGSPVTYTVSHSDKTLKTVTGQLEVNDNVQLNVDLPQTLDIEISDGSSKEVVAYYKGIYRITAVGGGGGSEAGGQGGKGYKARTYAEPEGGN